MKRLVFIHIGALIPSQPDLHKTLVLEYLETSTLHRGKKKNSVSQNSGLLILSLLAWSDCLGMNCSRNRKGLC